MSEELINETTEEGIVLKDRNGNDVAYYGIETVTFDTTTEGKQQTYSKGVLAEGVEVTLALADGDQVIQAPDGYLVKEATIKKPETLLPENIANGVDIAGVTGEYEGNLLEDLPIELDFSQGDQTVTAPDGYGVKSAIIAKPENLIPDNIREGETVAGIPGAFAGGSPQSKAINFYDVYGNIVYSYTRAQAATLTELPEVPAIDGYEAAGWQRTLADVQSCKAFMDVGAKYTKDGDLVGFLVLDVVAGDVIGVRMYNSSSLDTDESAEVQIDWGDGTNSIATITESNTTVTASHTYSAGGVYLVALRKVTKTSTGGNWNMYLGRYLSTAGVAGQSVIVGGETGTHGRLLAVNLNGDRIYPAPGCFANEVAMTFANLDSLSVPSHCFQNCRSLQIFMGRRDAMTLNSQNALYGCTALKRLTAYQSVTNSFSSGTFIPEIHVGTSPMFFTNVVVKNVILSYSSWVQSWGSSLSTTALQNIYVPADLLETYNTKFPAFTSYYRPLDEYPDY